jgi:hypothetical protein
MAQDWAADTAEFIERSVREARERLVQPTESLGDALVAGTMVGVLGVAAIVLAAICVFQVLVIVARDNAWIAWLVLGLFFDAGGTALWRRRRTLPTDVS